MTSNLAWTREMDKLVKQKPVLLHFPQYTTDQLVELITTKMLAAKAMDDSDLFCIFVRMFVSSMVSITRDVYMLQKWIPALYEKYCANMTESERLDGKARNRAFSKLAPDMKDMSELQVTSKEYASKNMHELDNFAQLSRLHQCILLASFICMNTPEAKDFDKFAAEFDSSKKKRRKATNKEEGTVKAKKQNDFSHPRFLAVIRALLESTDIPAKYPAALDDVCEDVAYLCSLNLISKRKKFEDDIQKYRCTINFEIAEKISHRLNVKINNLLS